MNFKYKANTTVFGLVFLDDPGEVRNEVSDRDDLTI